MTTRAFIEHKLEEAEAKLAEAVKRVDEAKAELARFEEDKYPVGTILRLKGRYGGFPVLIKFRSIWADLGFKGDTSLEFPASTEPVWVYIHGDMSGRTFPTLAEAFEWAGEFGTTSFDAILPPANPLPF